MVGKTPVRFPNQTLERQSLFESHRQRRWLTHWSYPSNYRTGATYGRLFQQPLWSAGHGHSYVRTYKRACPIWANAATCVLSTATSVIHVWLVQHLLGAGPLPDLYTRILDTPHGRQGHGTGHAVRDKVVAGRPLAPLPYLKHTEPREVFHLRAHLGMGSRLADQHLRPTTMAQLRDPGLMGRERDGPAHRLPVARSGEFGQPDFPRTQAGCREGDRYRRARMYARTRS
jgi:hypothetical protein